MEMMKWTKPGTVPPRVSIPGVPKSAIIEAIRRKLDVLKGDELQEGEYPIHGIVSIALDCIVKKDAPTKAKQAVRFDTDTVAKVLASLCAHANVSLAQTSALVEAAILTEAPAAQLEATTLGLNRAKEKLTAQLPSQPRAGACHVTGNVTLVGGSHV